LTLSAQTVITLTQPLEASGDIAINQQGEIFIGDFGESYQVPLGTNIYRIFSGGQVNLFFSGVGGAAGMDFDRQGNLYVSNFITSAGIVSRITPGGQIDPFAFFNDLPTGIVVDDSGNVFIANCGANLIQKFDPGGNLLQQINSNYFSCTHGLAFDDSGNLYATNWDNGNIIRIFSDGTSALLATLPGTGNGHISYARGDLYVAARSENQIYRITLSGVAELFAGTGVRGLDDGPALQATFSLPNGLAASRSGDTLFVSDVVPLSGDTLHPNIVRMILLDDPNAIGDIPAPPVDDFTLFQNYPNPFNPSTTIRYRLERPAKIILKIYDGLGREIKTLIDSHQPAGIHKIQWDGTEQQSNPVGGGIYFYRLQAGSLIQARKMLLVR
jgi:sugar lactone lactonase YvrE